MPAPYVREILGFALVARMSDGSIMLLMSDDVQDATVETKIPEYDLQGMIPVKVQTDARIRFTSCTLMLTRPVEGSAQAAIEDTTIVLPSGTYRALPLPKD